MSGQRELRLYVSMASVTKLGLRFFNRLPSSQRFSSGSLGTEKNAACARSGAATRAYQMRGVAIVAGDAVIGVGGCPNCAWSRLLWWHCWQRSELSLGLARNAKISLLAAAVLASSPWAACSASACGLPGPWHVSQSIDAPRSLETAACRVLLN